MTIQKIGSALMAEPTKDNYIWFILSTCLFCYWHARSNVYIGDNCSASYRSKRKPKAKEKDMTNLNKKQAAKLDKIFNLYNDAAAKSTEESAAAYEDLKRCCEAFKYDFEAFLKSKGVTVEKTNSATEETSASTDKQAKAPRVSRRDFIIKHIRENVWCKDSLAEAIALHFPGKYEDLKRNKGAVSGTIYDLTTNYNADITVCDKTGRIIFRSMKAKHK